MSSYFDTKNRCLYLLDKIHTDHLSIYFKCYYSLFFINYDNLTDDELVVKYYKYKKKHNHLSWLESYKIYKIIKLLVERDKISEESLVVISTKIVELIN